MEISLITDTYLFVTKAINTTDVTLCAQRLIIFPCT